MNETKKTDLKSYEAPETKRTQVELEGDLCGSVNAGAKSPGASTTAQEVNQDFGAANDFTDGSWDNN